MQTTDKPEEQKGEIIVREKSPKSSGTKSCGQMRQGLTCARVNGRGKCGEKKEIPMNQSIPPHP